MRYSLKGFQCQSFPDSNVGVRDFPSQIFSLFRWSQGILSHKLESLSIAIIGKREGELQQFVQLSFTHLPSHLRRAHIVSYCSKSPAGAPRIACLP
jgi:hypothetical protein